MNRKILLIAISWGLLLGLCSSYSCLAIVSQQGTVLSGTSATLVWNTTWGGVAADIGRDVVLDTSGNLYVGGYTYGWGSGGADAILGKFQSNGELANNATLGGPGIDTVYDLAMTTNGQIAAVGWTLGWGLPGYDGSIITWNNDLGKVSNYTVGGASSDQLVEVLPYDIGKYYVGGQLGPIPNHAAEDPSSPRRVPAAELRATE